MSPRVTPIKKEPFVQRSVKPAAAVFLTAAVSTAVYSMSQDIDVPWLRALAVNISGPLAFASIGFGALLVYPMAFFRGAGAGERILASLFTPLVWVIQEIIREMKSMSLLIWNSGEPMRIRQMYRKSRTPSRINGMGIRPAAVRMSQSRPIREPTLRPPLRPGGPGIIRLNWEIPR